MSYLSSSDKVGRGNIDNNFFQLYDMYDNNILKNDTRQGRNKIKEIRKKKSSLLSIVIPSLANINVLGVKRRI